MLSQVISIWLPVAPRTWTRLGSSGGVNVGAAGWSSVKGFKPWFFSVWHSRQNIQIDPKSNLKVAVIKSTLTLTCEFFYQKLKA